MSDDFILIKINNLINIYFDNSEEIQGFMGTCRGQSKLAYTNQREASRKKQRSDNVKDFPGWREIEWKKDILEGGNCIVDLLTMRMCQVQRLRKNFNSLD